MDHDGFIYTFVKMIKTAMGADETNEYANMTLMFCAKFITSFEGEETHPVMIDVFRWLLTVNYCTEIVSSHKIENILHFRQFPIIRIFGFVYVNLLI